MKTRNSPHIWFAGFAVGLLLYIVGVTPVRIATRDSQGIAGSLGWYLYSPIAVLRKHSDRIDLFYKEQWYFWFSIVT